jgi:hypothetical protein
VPEELETTWRRIREELRASAPPPENPFPERTPQFAAVRA